MEKLDRHDEFWKLQRDAASKVGDRWFNSLSTFASPFALFSCRYGWLEAQTGHTAPFLQF